MVYAFPPVSQADVNEGFQYFAEMWKPILAEFKKKKALPPELASNAINMINANAGINIVFLVRPFNLAPPFMPPPIFAEGKK